MICVSISHREQITGVLNSGADLIELRLDLMGQRPDQIFPGIPEGVRTVVTCRPGEFSQEERAGMFVTAIRLGASYVDLEVESEDEFARRVSDAARAEGCQVIYSYHNFESTPGKEELQNILTQCFERGGDVAKIATAVRSGEDVTNLFSLFSLPGRKVVLGMGEQGRITRVAGPYLGGEFTFASPGDGQETAPGQLSLSQLQTIYKMIGS